MTIATKTLAGQRILARTYSLPAVIALTEQCFVSAGDNLAMAVDSLNRTKAIFTRLETTLGDDTGRQLSQLISTVMANLTGIRADLDGLLNLGDASRMAVRRVRAEVSELDRIVRSIACVSVNARILGNVLSPPRPQVVAFIDHLDTLSGEAEAVLTEVKDEVTGIVEDTQTMDLILQELRIDLLQRVLPALGQIAAIAQSFEDGRAEMARVSAGLADQMREVFTEVSRLIIALQVGDATRQRLQRVQSVLDRQACPDRPAQTQSAGLDRVLTDLARAPVDAAKSEAQADIDVSILALEVVLSRADMAMQEARRFYFARAGVQRRGNGISDAPESLEDSRERVQRHIAAMRTRADVICQRLEQIMGYEVQIRRIKHAVWLSGLNAVIVCAKLGSEGRALRELAHWLRSLIDESDIIETRLSHELSQTRTYTEQGIAAHVDRLDAALSTFVGDAGRLGAVMKRINLVVGDAAKGFDLAGRRLPVQIGQGLHELQTFRAALSDLDDLSLMLGLLASRMVQPVAPFDATSDAAAFLAQVRSTYTMQQERLIHDTTLTRVLAPCEVSATAGAATDTVATCEKSTDSDGPDMDDIFF